MPAPHPLRRISTGSLSTLARSQDRAHSSPSGLDFLQPAITELADEAATLSTNIQRLNDLHDALGTFNEAFAGWMYALKMNAFCVEFPEVSEGSEVGSGVASCVWGLAEQLSSPVASYL
jgi:DASH complex subunit DAM1